MNALTHGRCRLLAAAILAVGLLGGCGRGDGPLLPAELA